MLSMQKGIKPDVLEELFEKTKLEGARMYEKFVGEKIRYDSKQLIIEAYEEILKDRRLKERDVLNGRRFKEYEKNRPPQSNWYELKSGEFSKEHYRNRMALKPNDSNTLYLKTL